MPYRTNSDGFRDGEPGEKRPGVPRVVVLGDSYVFGWAVLEAETFPRRAEALLRNDLLIEAFAILDAEYVKAWRLTHINDVNARERLFQAVQIVAKIKDHLGKVLNNGKLAQRELDDLEAKRKRFGII